MSATQDDNSNLSRAIIQVFQDKLGKTFEWTLTQDPEVVERDVIEYSGRMRASGLEKFNGPSYVTVVNFYFSQHDLERKNTCGAFILYVGEESIERILKAMGHRDFDEEDRELIKNGCKEFCALIVDDLKHALGSLGFRELINSEPTSYRNDILEGVLYPTQQNKFSEISFYLWNKKALVVDAVMAPPQ